MSRFLKRFPCWVSKFVKATSHLCQEQLPGEKRWEAEIKVAPWKHELSSISLGICVLVQLFLLNLLRSFIPLTHSLTHYNSLSLSLPPPPPPPPPPLSISFSLSLSLSLSLRRSPPLSISRCLFRSVSLSPLSLSQPFAHGLILLPCVSFLLVHQAHREAETSGRESSPTNKTTQKVSRHRFRAKT